MHRKLKNLIKNIKELFSLEFINKISRKTKFVQRESVITAEKFLSFNIFHGHDICEKSLSRLCSRLDSEFGILVSKQALNERFNEYSVEFMREIFNEMLTKQNKALQEIKSNLLLHFNRIIINDSTSFILPKEFKEEFSGSGGVASDAAVKIQLQYELLSGMFMCCDILPGTRNDADYLNTMTKYNEVGDLKLADLGYYKVDYLKKIHNSGAFFISKLKSNTAVYMKNPNPEKHKIGSIKKSTEYIKIDIQEIVQPLAEGTTIELKDIYIGSKKELKSRLIITKLTEENKLKREITHKKNADRKRGSLNEQRIAWNSINVYITNVSEEILNAEQIHDVYSLRWEIEIMFKVWKSIFNIHKVKKVKIERFKCFLYGRLISLLLTSSIVFTSKNIIYEEENKEISEIKSFGTVIEYFPKLSRQIFKGELRIVRILETILITLKKSGIKSRKKDKKIVTDILEFIKIDSIQLEELVG